MVKCLLVVLTLGVWTHLVSANRYSQAQLISSQPRQVSRSGQSSLQRTALQIRELLHKIEFVDLRPRDEAGKRSEDVHLTPRTVEEDVAWAGVERFDSLESRSDDSRNGPIANTTFLIATTPGIAAEYGCDPQPWTWTFQSSPALASNVSTTSSAVDPSMTANASIAEAATAIYPNAEVGLHILAAQSTQTASPTPTPDAQADSIASESDNGPRQTGTSEPPLLLESSEPASAAPAQNISPLRRKLSNTRPRAVEALEAALSIPLDSRSRPNSPERRDKKAGYAVDKDEATLDWLSSNLNLYQGKVSVGDNNLRLAPDPLALVGSNSSSTILSVFYPQGSYAPSKSDPIGGASFYAQPFLGTNNAVQQQQGMNSTDQIHYRSTLVLQYSVAFPLDFDFVKGGKLPGLYSSVGLPSNGSNDIPAGELDANTDTCSGGARDGVGLNCWSARIMWRQGGIGEVYAYFPTDKSGEYDPCRTRSQTMICNEEYGTSVGRGTFGFVPGTYTNLTLVVTLNSSPTTANGELSLWVNGQQAINEPNMLFRTGTVGVRATGHGGGSGGEAFRVMEAKLKKEEADDNASVPSRKRDASNETDVSQSGAQWVDKVFFSTFFGGSTPDYAASKDEEAYFKDFSLYSGTRYSSAPGISAAGSSSSAARQTAPKSVPALVVSLVLGGLVWCISLSA
ncbi:unnamed protein product [Tilletia controversa]|uniref:Polysaccharide lyase 14 domain-containing protein n=1 Tax=Tilletia controversa TaxID=13291 RepID=A0A8X7MWA2_9BASI|nr:hypothetical protein A4X06_0g2178 [Tilletia controversa]CAD6918872.1 unnamed protein product [Tilletia controversa]CAD6925568.1 unnamed protein product [Tilletia controversa]CAD6969181.1 unnamed protein product [Tilletia controversa]